MELLVERARMHAHLGSSQAADADAARVAALAHQHPSDRATFYARDARMFAAAVRPAAPSAMDAAVASFEASIRGATMATRLLREGSVAMFHVYRGEYAEGLAVIDRVLARGRDRGPHGVDMETDAIWFLHVRIEALAGLGREEEAAQAILEAVSLCPADPPLQDVVVILASAQLVLAAQGKPEHAARLFGWLDRGGRFDSPDREAALAALRPGRRQLGEMAIGLAIKDGAAADPLALLRSLPSWLAESATSAARQPLRHGELTRREVEIIELVARGKTNREIADALFISPKTASVHVGNIKEKLGAQSRLEIALRGRAMGLADVARSIQPN
jgi:DNA-binding CsgD family transcriptional regulator